MEERKTMNLITAEISRWLQHSVGLVLGSTHQDQLDQLLERIARSAFCDPAKTDPTLRAAKELVNFFQNNGGLLLSPIYCDQVLRPLITEVILTAGQRAASDARLQFLGLGTGAHSFGGTPSEPSVGLSPLAMRAAAVAVVQKRIDSSQAYHTREVHRERVVILEQIKRDIEELEP
jgi:hypothetical protein